MTLKKSNKAATYSAIIFPGAGLWWLKLYVRACVFIIPAGIALGYIAIKLVNSVAPIYTSMLRDAQEGLIVVDASNFISTYTKLYNEMHQGMLAQQSQLNVAEVILIASWLCSIVSSYFAGKKMDLENHTRNIKQ